jgi:hypothetical protein
MALLRLQLRLIEAGDDVAAHSDIFLKYGHAPNATSNARPTRRPITHLLTGVDCAACMSHATIHVVCGRPDALLCAVLHSERRSVELLIAGGANVNRKDCDG